MKIGHMIDENEFLIEDVLTGGEPDVTEICPDGFHKPKWNGTAWVEGEDALFLLEVEKEKKIKEFTSQRDSEVQAGFLTNAVTSTPNIPMGYDLVDKNNYQSIATMLNLDPTMKSVNFLTGNGMVTFTRDEFIQVIKDAYDHESSLVYKCLTLKAQIEAAVDKTSLDAIVW